MTLIEYAERHIDTSGKIWPFYNKPKYPLEPPKGSRWIPLKQDIPKFRDRSQWFIDLELRKIKVREQREKEKWERQQRKRELEIIAEYNREKMLLEDRRRLQYEESRKTRLTSITTTNAITVSKRLESKGWKKIATGTWKNPIKCNLLKIVFKNHTWKDDQFFIEAHFRKPNL